MRSAVTSTAWLSYQPWQSWAPTHHLWGGAPAGGVVRGQRDDAGQLLPFPGGKAEATEMVGLDDGNPPSSGRQNPASCF